MYERGGERGGDEASGAPWARRRSQSRTDANDDAPDGLDDAGEPLEEHGLRGLVRPCDNVCRSDNRHGEGGRASGIASATQTTAMGRPGPSGETHPRCEPPGRPADCPARRGAEQRGGAGASIRRRETPWAPARVRGRGWRVRAMTELSSLSVRVSRLARLGESLRACTLERGCTHRSQAGSHSSLVLLPRVCVDEEDLDEDREVDEDLEGRAADELRGGTVQDEVEGLEAVAAEPREDEERAATRSKRGRASGGGGAARTTTLDHPCSGERT